MKWSQVEIMSNVLQSLGVERTAIVCDWLTSRGGAEKVTETIAEMFPEADIFASVVDYKKFPWLRERKVFTSWLQNIPWLGKKHQLFPHVRPYIFENFNFDNYDLVISSSSAESKNIITKPETIHICYCHTPIRYYWSDYHEYLANRMEFGWLNPIINMVMPYFTHELRMQDRLAAERVDYFIANSKNTAERINKYYRKKSTVLNPPVECDGGSRQRNNNYEGDFYLYLSRLVPYKKADLLAKAFVENGKKLVIAGEGPLTAKIKKIIKGHNNVELITYPSDETKWKLMSDCAALIFPGEEDFGIVPVEAMSCGKPVIAYGKGGAKETVWEDVTGIFFEEQTIESINLAVDKFERMKFDVEEIARWANNFDKNNFMERFIKLVGRCVRNGIEVEY